MKKDQIEVFAKSRYLVELKLRTKNEKIITILGTILQIFDDGVIIFQSSTRKSAITPDVILQVTETNLIAATNQGDKESVL